MKRKTAFYKAIQTASAMALTMSIAFTGVSAAGAPSRVPAAGVVSEAAKTDNQYEAFLGFGKGAYLINEGTGGDAVNLWSGNYVAQCAIPVGNAYNRFPLVLTYNSQADCDIGFGNNVVVNFWAQLTYVDVDHFTMTTGTGAVDTYVRNTATGRYECGEWYFEILPDGRFHAFARDGEYYFNQHGRATRAHLYSAINMDVVDISYNDDSTIRSISNQMGACYEFAYTRLRNKQTVCEYLHQMYLEYDENGNLLSMRYAGDDPANSHYELAYGSGPLATQFIKYDYVSNITYQNINGYDKVVNFNGTQIVYGKNQTITIDPNGTVTTWQFDDEGNLI